MDQEGSGNISQVPRKNRVVSNKKNIELTVDFREN